MKLITVGLTTTMALMLVACLGKDAKKTDAPVSVNKELKNTYWHKGYFYVLDANNKATSTYISLPTMGSGMSTADKTFGFIGNDGASAFVFLRGNSGIGTQEGNSNPVSMALGKVSANKFSGKIYDFTTSKDGEKQTIAGKQVTFKNSFDFEQTFSFAKNEKDYKKKIVSNFDLLGFKFKGEANNLDSIKTGALKAANASYSCNILTDGYALAGSPKVKTDKITIEHKHSNTMHNNCSFKFKFDETYKQANKPTQYSVSGSLGACNSPVLNNGEYAKWLTATDFKGIGVAYEGNNLIAYLASDMRNKAIILVCN